LQLIDSRTVRVLTTILLFAAVMAFIYLARHTLIAFLFAIFFAYLIDPMVARVERRLKGKRGQAIAIIYAGLLIALAIFFLLVGPRLGQEASKLAKTLPQLYEKVATGEIVGTFGSRHGWSEETQRRTQEFLDTHRDQILGWLGEAGTRVASLAAYSWWLVLIPILAVFFLKDGKALAEGAIEALAGGRQRQFAEGVLQDIHTMLAHYLRAQIILAALSLVFYVIVLLVLHVGYAVVLGTIGGALEFVPVVGPLVAAVLIVGVALGLGYGHMVILLLLLAGWRILQDYVNSPRIMGSRVELHPLAALFGVLAGAELGGVVGVYLSIPIMATLRIVWRRWRAYDRQSIAST